jgi:hypothetical protein
MLAIIGCAIGRSENVRGIVPDPESRRAWGIQTHPLKIAPLGQGLKGVKNSLNCIEQVKEEWRWLASLDR